MEFEMKAKIRIEHWLKHTSDHMKEYEQFADELEKTGNSDSARYIREIGVLTAESLECMENALSSIGTKDDR